MVVEHAVISAGEDVGPNDLEDVVIKFTTKNDFKKKKNLKRHKQEISHLQNRADVMV